MLWCYWFAACGFHNLAVIFSLKANWIELNWIKPGRHIWSLIIFTYVFCAWTVNVAPMYMYIHRWLFQSYSHFFAIQITCTHIYIKCKICHNIYLWFLFQPHSQNNNAEPHTYFYLLLIPIRNEVIPFLLLVSFHFLLVLALILLLLFIEKNAPLCTFVLV